MVPALEKDHAPEPIPDTVMVVALELILVKGPVLVEDLDLALERILAHSQIVELKSVLAQYLMLSLNFNLI